MKPHAPKMRVLRVGGLMPHALRVGVLRARLSDHNLAIAGARRAKDRALVIAAAHLVKDRALVIAAMARAKGHDLATEIGIVVMGRDSVAVGDLVVVVVGHVAARFVHSVSIM